MPVDPYRMSVWYSILLYRTDQRPAWVPISGTLLAPHFFILLFSPFTPYSKISYLLSFSCMIDERPLCLPYCSRFVGGKQTHDQ